MVHWKKVFTVIKHWLIIKMDLANDENAYGKGTWASSIRYKNETCSAER